MTTPDATLPDATPPSNRGTSTTRRAACMREAWRAGVTPRADGLPNKRVLLVPLVLLAAVFVALVSLGLTGSSTGIVHSQISTTADPDRVFGSGQPTRSDEWFVQTTWTISQVEQGLPIRNETFPGGMDATVQHDLPTTDWSTAFRPHLVGFLFLPLDQAMAVKWWLPGFAMMGAVYMLAITLLPRRPLSALALSVAFYAAPFFQWWYLSITFYAAAWALLVMATTVWCLRAPRRPGRWILAGVLAYLTVTLATGIYVPFIVPVALVALGFSVGIVLTRDSAGAGVARNLRRIAPVFVAGAVGLAIIGVWLVTRWDTIVGFTSTVYPGERLQPVGLAGLQGLDALLSGPLSVGLERTGGQPFDANSSEASTFLLPGFFLIASLIWLLVDRVRRKAGTDWLVVCLLLTTAVMLAFLFLPGWDAVAHLLLLDRTTYGRMRIGFGLLSLVVVVVVAMRVEQRRDAGLPRIPRWVPSIGVVLAAVSVFRVVWVAVDHFGAAYILDEVPLAALALGVVLLLVFLLVVWTYGVGALAAGTAALLVLSVASSALVNPIYRGVLDLRATETAQMIETLNAESPGNWVGVSREPVTTMLLIETAVASYNGFQSAPADEMWAQIDPHGEFEGVWNRLANVSWVPGDGDPLPRNPAADQIELTFDSCANFAQQNIDWVLSDRAIDQPCISLVETIEQGPTQMRIYAVEVSP